MRVKSSIINISAGLGNQIIITSLSFISRTVFINSLGAEYLGINGLLTNILAMLSLAEAGIGSSIMYSLYKPVAENDQQKINMLMRLYRNAYMVIALVVLLLGLSLMPFLGYFVKDTSVENIHLIYGIFLLNTVAPYLYSHRSSLLNVYQKGYIVTGIYSISSIASVCFKIGILHFTKNYILYLVIDSIVTITTSIFLAIIVGKLYPFLKEKVSSKLDDETKNSIIKNIKAIVLQNIGNYLVLGTDNIIISSFVSVTAVGLYSNYSMLIDICRNFTYQIFNNIYHSVGNLVAKESIDKIYSIYKIYTFLNFWLYSFFGILLCVTLEPFINLWIGSKFLMSKNILFILIIIFYERGMRNAITTVKTTAGIFHEDKYAPLIQALINLVFSIVLVQSMGIAGVFIGTLVSVLAVPFWFTPHLVYKKVFKKSILNYYIRYIYYAAVGLGTYFITNFISKFILLENLLGLTLKAVVCLIIPNLIYITIFHKTNEFRYLFGIIKSIIGKLLRRFNPNKGVTY